MRWRFFVTLSWICALVWMSVVPAFTAAASIPSHSFPKRANFFLSLDLTSKDVSALSSWDVVVLNMNQQLLHPELLRELKRRNPSIVLLAYVGTQEISTGLDGAAGSMPMSYRLWRGIQPQWFLRSHDGRILSWWPNTYLLNVTSDCPVVNGQTWQTYLARFVVNDVLGSGLWDGIFYDNTWDNITYFAGSSVDLSLAGVASVNPDEKWRSGMMRLFEDTRRLAPKDIVLVGNNDTKAYETALNGLLIENFSPTSWQHQMERYRFNEQVRRTPHLNIINANTANSGREDSYQRMRFGLTSALLENGYYSFDFGDQNHGQTWWYDEYQVDLGTPVSRAVSPSGTAPYAPSIWKREFTRGLSIVNSTDAPQRVVLQDPYEKINGTQDPKINDGSIVNEIIVPAHDGVVLLKVLERLFDVVYRNGAFARFLRPDGTRVRNGFFVYQGTRKGGDTVVEIDIDNNGKRDLVVASGPRLSVWRDDGERYMEVFPYTANYAGDLHIAVADIDNDEKDDIVVVPSTGQKQPVKIYSRHGELMKDAWFPFGKTYRGGMSVAVGNIDATPEKEIVIGAGTGIRPTIRVYRMNGSIIREWLAFEEQFRGGVNVGVGDITGDDVAEVALAPMSGKTPVIRLFSGAGKRLTKDIIPYISKDRSGLDVQIQDVNFDGKNDIIALSRSVGI